MINILPPKILFFLETTKKIERNLQLISKLLQKTVNYKLLSSGGPSPQNMAQTFDGPTTIKRSGSEHRRAVSLFFPEGEKIEMRGGAFFNGKEGRDDFRTHFLQKKQSCRKHPFLERMRRLQNRLFILSTI